MGYSYIHSPTLHRPTINTDHRPASKKGTINLVVSCHRASDHTVIRSRTAETSQSVMKKNVSLYFIENTQ